MEIKLTQRDIDAIAYRTALILAKMQKKNEPPELVSTAEAAKILNISPAYLRQIADRYPHVKQGDEKQARLLFDRKALINRESL